MSCNMGLPAPGSKVVRWFPELNESAAGSRHVLPPAFGAPPTAEPHRKPEDKGACCANYAGQPSGQRAGQSQFREGSEAKRRCQHNRPGQCQVRGPGHVTGCASSSILPKMGKATSVLLHLLSWPFCASTFSRIPFQLPENLHLSKPRGEPGPSAPP